MKLHASGVAIEFSTLVEMLRTRAGESPAARAFAFLDDGGAEERLSYAELDERARAIAVQLLERSARGERVLLLYPPGLEYIAAFFGCLYAGAVAVPAYPPRQNRSLPRLRSILADARPLVALTTAVIPSRVDGGWREQAHSPLRFRRQNFYPCYDLAETTLIAVAGHPRRVGDQYLLSSCASSFSDSDSDHSETITRLPASGHSPSIDIHEPSWLAHRLHYADR